MFGWSFGGVLAFEIAKQLVKRGDTVANIIFVDSYFSYRKAVMFGGMELTENVKNNINYEYYPWRHAFDKTNILLFKANDFVIAEDQKNQQKDPELNNTRLLYQYYVQRTKYNHLDDILAPKCINIVDIDSNHVSWVNDLSVIEKISNVSRELIKHQFFKKNYQFIDFKIAG